MCARDWRLVGRVSCGRAEGRGHDDSRARPVRLDSGQVSGGTPAYRGEREEPVATDTHIFGTCWQLIRARSRIPSSWERLRASTLCPRASARMSRESSPPRPHPELRSAHPAALVNDRPARSRRRPDARDVSQRPAAERRRESDTPSAMPSRSRVAPSSAARCDRGPWAFRGEIRVTHEEPEIANGIRSGDLLPRLPSSRHAVTRPEPSQEGPGTVTARRRPTRSGRRGQAGPHRIGTPPAALACFSCTRGWPTSGRTDHSGARPSRAIASR